MSNHVHLVLRLRPERVDQWTQYEVAHHALSVFPARSGWQNECFRSARRLLRAALQIMPGSNEL
jgi:hypothetical protein